MARAPALHAGGQRFESVILHYGNKDNDKAGIPSSAAPEGGDGGTEERETTQNEKTTSAAGSRTPVGVKLDAVSGKGETNKGTLRRQVAERVPKVYGVYKGAWGMPRLSEATKDVISCEKPR